MRSFYVAQASLELLSSSDLHAAVSQSAKITGVSHHAQPQIHSQSIMIFFFCLDITSNSTGIIYIKISSAIHIEIVGVIHIEIEIVVSK